MSTLAKSVPWPIYLVCAIHLGWAVVILVGPQQRKPVTSLYHLDHLAADLTGQPGGMPDKWLMGVGMAAVSLLALAGTHCHARRWSLWATLPQQLIVLLAAAGAVVSVCREQFPDGYPSPWDFILKDQMGAILLAVFHSLNVIELHMPAVWARLIFWK